MKARLEWDEEGKVVVMPMPEVLDAERLPRSHFDIWEARHGLLIAMPPMYFVSSQAVDEWGNPISDKAMTVVPKRRRTGASHARRQYPRSKTYYTLRRLWMLKKLKSRRTRY